MSLLHGIKFIDTSDNVLGFKVVDGKPRISTTPIGIDIARGNFTGERPWSKIGYCANINATERDLAPQLGGLYPFPASAVTINIVSTVDNDKSTGGGARTITVHYLKSDCSATTSTVSMNGTANVLVASDAFRVNNVRVMTTGTSNNTIGNICVFATGATLGYISAGQTRMRQLVWTVPLGQTLYISQATFSAAKQAAAHYIKFTTRANADNLTGTILQRGLFQAYNEVILGNAPMTQMIDPPVKIPATVDIKVSVVADGTDTADATCALRGWLE
jgi:hypothetical protein